MVKKILMTITNPTEQLVTNTTVLFACKQKIHYARLKKKGLDSKHIFLSCKSSEAFPLHLLIMDKIVKIIHSISYPCYPTACLG